MKTDETCTHRGMWCASGMKRQRNEHDEVTVTLRALDMFCTQLQLHLSHIIDENTVTLAIKACQGDSKSRYQIHGFASYTTVSNSLMRLYTKAGQFDGQFDGPLLIFQTMCCTDIVSWNTILSWFRTSEGALNFALMMNFNGVLFYPRRLIEARNVFDEMANEDVVSWNAILAGYSQEGNHGLEAIFVFIEMVEEGMGLDHVSFTSAVSACGHEMNLELGKQIHGLTIKSGYGSHVSVCNVLISTYLKCEVTEDAKLVFRCMNDRNIVSWTTMISIDEEDAISLFNEVRLDGVYPNDVTFVGIIHAISIRKLVEEGEMIHGFCIKTGFLSKRNVCNSLGMLSLSPCMTPSKLELNCREIISWNALISGYAQKGLCALLDMYAKRGSICESKRVFSETPHKSQFAWIAIISAYAGHGDYDSVIELFKEMEREGVRPDSVTFLSILAAGCRNGMVEMGRHLFHSMVKDYHIEPSPQHYSSMVDMLGCAGKLEEAQELMSQIPGQPGFSLLRSLLGACRIHGNVEMAERVANTLMRLEPMESGSFVLMSNLYAEKGDWEMVAKLGKWKRDEGVRKEL
ncbi:unnamed protein product [Prunus armeniaca]